MAAALLAPTDRMTFRDLCPVDAAEVARRVIEPDQFVADTKAFVDVRIDRSRGKASYSFIGPGVSQNSDQKINLAVPHGFNVGAASMPTGVVNNPHLHYTAEVFICSRGSYKMTIGRNSEQHIDLQVGDVFAAPTWVFRGFENTGPDNSWVFVVLGGDDTGGIIWSPDVLREAADTGLYLGADNSLIDAAAGGSVEQAVSPASDDALSTIDTYTDDELESHVVRADDRAWSKHALLSSVIDGHASELAPVLGFGMSEYRGHRAPVMTAQGFSVEWLRVPAGQSTGVHRIAESQVLLLVEGDWKIGFNTDEDLIESKPASGSVVSMPENAWRDFANIGSGDALAAVVCGTDSPNTIEWSPQVVAQARQAGWVRDAAAKIAPSVLLTQGRDQ